MARTVRVGIACVLLASACTGGGSDDEPQDEGAAVSSTATSVAGGTTGDLTVAEPTPLFTAVDVPEFVTEGDHIEINAAIPLGGTTWLAIAMLDQPEARRRDPVAIEIDLDRPDDAITTVLPFDDSVTAKVNDLALRNSTAVAAGSIIDDGVSRPVVWEREGDEWTEYPLEAEPGAWASFTSFDGTVVLGKAMVNGVTEPRIWQHGPTGWQPLGVADGAGEHRPWLRSAITTDAGVVAVGGIYNPATDKYSPTVWTVGSNGLEVASEASESLPEFGMLRDIIETEKGLVVVGSSLAEGVSSPLSASATDPEDAWLVSHPIIDTGGRSVVTGFGFRDVIALDGVLFVSLSNGYLQTVSQSNDEGQTWTELPGVFARSRSEVSSFAFAVQNGVVLLGGRDLLFVSSSNTWARVSSLALPRLGTSKKGRDVVHTEGDGFLLGGTITTQDSDSLAQPWIALWSSPDGQDWDSVQLNNPLNKTGSTFVLSPDGPIYFGSAKVAGGGQIAAWSGPEGSDFWRSKSFGLSHDDVARAILNGAVSDGTTTSVVGVELVRLPNGSTQSRPLAQVIDVDGNFGPATIETVAPVDVNSEIVCVAALEGGGYFAVVEWGRLGHDLITSSDGLTWSSIGNSDPFDGLTLTSCGTATDGRWLVSAADSDIHPFVLTSDDGLTWDRVALPVGSAGKAFQISHIDDITVAVGSARSTDNANYEPPIAESTDEALLDFMAKKKASMEDAWY